MSTVESMAQMEKAPDEFASLIQGKNEAALSKRPDGKNWAAKEIICHVRDTEEVFLTRLQAIVLSDEPKFFTVDADRWAEDRQYLRNDHQEALKAFRKRRGETLKFLRELKPEQWERTGIHPTRGRETMKDLVGMIAKHDINHLEHLKRALSGQP